MLFFNRFCDGDPANLSLFWEELERRQDPRLASHPMKKIRNWKQLAIPLMWHGDGVASLSTGGSSAKTFEVYSYSGILSRGSSLATKVYCFGYMQDNKAGAESLAPLWRRACWSFDAAAAGTWPSKDDNGVAYDARSLEGRRAGSPIAGGYFFVIYTFKQDLDHLAREYNLADYRKSVPCELCPCNKDSKDWPMNFCNFSGTAAWKRMHYTAAQWNESHDSPHPLFRSAHVTCLNVEPDEAHVLHLGVGQHVVGSVLWLLVYSCSSLEGTPAEKMAKIWDSIRVEYKAAKASTQMTALALKSFHGSQKFSEAYPKLKSKAAECKDLIEPIRRTWQKYMNRRDADHRVVLDMLQALCDAQQILQLHAGLPILPLDVAKRFRNLIHLFLQLYSQLANAADREGVCLFAMVPKHHWLWHLGERSLFVNPRKSCCLLDEDYVGKVKQIVRSAAHGTALHVIQSKVADQYKFGFFVTLRFGT